MSRRRYLSLLGLAVFAAVGLLSAHRAWATYGTGSPQCEDPSRRVYVYSRCLTTGYFSGATGTDFKKGAINSKGQSYTYSSGITPLINSYAYPETWSGTTRSTFPSVSRPGSYTFDGVTYDYAGGPTTKNAAYTNVFVALIKSYINADFSAGGPNACTNGPIYVPPDRTDAPSGYNPAANARNLNYHGDQVNDPNGVSQGSTCFNLRRNAVGAAMIIATMNGKQGPDFGNYQTGIAYAKSVLPQWEQMVRSYDASGWVNWNAQTVATTGHFNSTAMNSGTDNEFFAWEKGAYNANVVVFGNPSQPNNIFTINRKCANLIGENKGLPGFDLQPEVAVSPDTVEPGQSISFGFQIENVGQTTSPAVPYNITYSVVSGSMSVPGTSSGTRAFGQGITRLRTDNLATSGVAPGTRVCATLRVGPPAAFNEPGVRTSKACSTVVAKPYFTTTGGDVSTGAAAPAAGVDCAVARNDKAGVVSWNRGASTGFAGAGTQYAALALGYLQDFATGQGTAGVQPSGLAFSNTNTSGMTRVDIGNGLYGGKLGASSCQPDYSLGSNITTGDKIIAGRSVLNGSHTVLYVKGDAYITGDITFSGAYGSAADIPSFTLIVEGSLFIAPNVHQLDGLYVAQATGPTNNDGVIYTCALGLGKPADLDKNLFSNCNSPLTVNGSFIARQVWLERTTGTVAANKPAEVFNYTPEVWIAPPFGTGANGQARNYSSITALPPVL